MRRPILRHAILTGHIFADVDGTLIAFASELLSDGERLELQSEPGRALSETEAADAIRRGDVVEVVS